MRRLKIKTKMATLQTKRRRANKIIKYLKQAYPRPKTELKYNTSFQCLVAVMLSAQCTDKLVNEVTKELFKEYKTVDDFAKASLAEFSKSISRVSFYNNKAKNIIASAQYLQEHFGGRLPKSVKELIELPGVAYKTANVVLGEVYDKWEGIATDTHVRRFAIRFELTDNTDLTKISKDLEELFDKKDWKYVNNGLVLYGRYMCPARPHDCSEHPLTKLIPSAASIWPKAK